MGKYLRLAQVLLIIGTHELCLQVFMFAILKRSRNSPNKSLANINEFTVFLNTGPYRAGNFKTLLLQQFSSDVSQTI